MTISRLPRSRTNSTGYESRTRIAVVWARDDHASSDAVIQRQTMLTSTPRNTATTAANATLAGTAVMAVISRWRTGE